MNYAGINEIIEMWELCSLAKQKAMIRQYIKLVEVGRINSGWPHYLAEEFGLRRSEPGATAEPTN